MSSAYPQVQTSPVEPPEYSADSIFPNGISKLAPLAPGMLMSIYGEHLGPDAACTGSADPERQEIPNPLRPNQALVERQVFPKRLCDTEVRVGGITAGLLYVHDRHINFKVPQELPVKGTTEVQVFYQGRAGPAVRMDLGNAPNTESAQQLTEMIWSGLQGVEWETPYRAMTSESVATCRDVPERRASRGGINGYAYYCMHQMTDVIAESFYYPTGDTRPTVLLRRADFRLGTVYPVMSDEVEQLLRDRLTQAYGPGTIPDRLFEIGARKPNPGLSWHAGEIDIFLHRNRRYGAPVGIRDGVQLIAIQREVFEERELLRELDEAFRSSTKLVHPTIGEDLNIDLGASYVMPQERPGSESERVKAEHETSAALLRLLREADEGDRSRRAAFLVAADDLTVRLGSHLVMRSIRDGGERLTVAPGADRIRDQLAPYGVKYSTRIGHYSGNLEYDRSLLHRAWEEFPDTPWGQRAFLMIQRLSCSLPRFGCQGQDCFQEVIRQGERFLREFPGTPFREEQIYHLALAYETWWSLSQAEAGEPTAEGTQVDEGSAEPARIRAIGLYEELLQIAPESPEARMGQLRLPRLKLGLGTGERSFFCFLD